MGRFRHPSKTLSDFLNEQIKTDVRKRPSLLPKATDKAGKLVRKDSENSEPEIYRSKKKLIIDETGIIEMEEEPDLDEANLKQLTIGMVSPFLQQTSNKARLVSKPVDHLTDK